MYRIVVVDSDPRCVRLVRSNLEQAGYRCLTAGDGDSALTLIEANDPDLIITELDLPKRDGFSLIADLRTWTTTPIIVLAANSASERILRAFQAGADDCVAKPFSTDELVARICAILRRAEIQPVTRETVLSVGDVHINTTSREVTVRGQSVQLAPKEYQLLVVLAQNAGKTVSHSDLLARVWGREYRDETDYLRVYIRYLRKRIEENPSKPKLVLTQTAFGYRLAAQ